MYLRQIIIHLSAITAIGSHKIVFEMSATTSKYPEATTVDPHHHPLVI